MSGKWLDLIDKKPVELNILYVRLQLNDGSEIEDCLSQDDGDFFWETMQIFISDHMVKSWMAQPGRSD